MSKKNYLESLSVDSQSTKEKFSIQQYINSNLLSTEIESESFEKVLHIIKAVFDKEWQDSDERNKEIKLEREKKAIIGYEREVNYYKERILSILREKRLVNSVYPNYYPNYYPNLTEAVFAELYGLSALAPWAFDMEERFVKSSSAKIIGDRIYVLIDGKTVLLPQRIPDARREQLKRALLIATPKERIEYGFHEIYLHNGIRITIYSGDRTKPGQDVMVFRKYILRKLSFEKLYEMGSIPFECIAMFKKMVIEGVNVIFSGPVRSGKTTFLQTWQSYESRELEGLAISTDPETPWHELMPGAPIMQIVADGKDLEEITKSLLRGDNDYVLLEEMRDAPAFKIALDITSTGSKRCKATIHINDAVYIPYRMASSIAHKYGGDINSIIAEVFKNFDYAVELIVNPDNRSNKLLKGIVKFEYDSENDEVIAREICKYDFNKKSWEFNEKIIKPAYYTRIHERN